MPINGTSPLQAPPPKPVNKTVASEGQQLVDAARKYLGEPYKLNNTGPEMSPGVKNCSGLIGAAGKDIGRPDLVAGSTTQMKMGKEVPLDPKTLQPGDIVYAPPNGQAGMEWGHVGIYAGNGKPV